ncbi:hypothetical protein [Cognatilysobacter segetis]|uniref:hypothetical protein n=1 Tax=Cognatilysobacter segetis TaxID=2492394 RepID=UPI00105D1E64|nr:hypothetical protein [Lysobacter segetis]
MTEQTTGYAVYLYEQAQEALGEAIKPYLLESPTGVYIACQAVDTAGSFVEMTIVGKDARGDEAETELMVPVGMVRMIVSSHSDTAFGFAARTLEPGLTALPVVGPDAPAPRTPSTATPQSGGKSGANAAVDDKADGSPEG